MKEGEFDSTLTRRLSKSAAFDIKAENVEKNRCKLANLLKKRRDEPGEDNEEDIADSFDDGYHEHAARISLNFDRNIID